MVAFTDQWLEEVQKATDIVAVVEERVQLKQTGKNFSGLCPFHDEKTPSFSVNPEKQFFYCFGCGAGGNVFNFVMRSENLSFPEAAESLARRAGIAVPNISPEQQRQAELREELFRINRLAAKFFYQNLRSGMGRGARVYLQNRDISGDLARAFFLGYAPNKWDGLIEFLHENQVDFALAKQAGLVIEGRKGLYDRFRNRIIFPICDHQGRFIGFGGRSVGNENPKYLNSPETPVFQKSHQLYGLNWAKEWMGKSSYIVVVEGYTDVISLHGQGIKNVVASLGTAFSASHARLLRNFTNEVVIAFDGDTAGEKATQRGLLILYQEGLRVKVASLKDGDDPDSYARNHTKGEVKDWLNRALPLWEYQIKLITERHNIANREGKLAASKELIIVLLNMESAVEQEEYLQYGASLLKIAADSLRKELAKQQSRRLQENFDNKLDKSRYTIKDLPKESKPPKSGNVEYSIERDVLRWILTKPALGEELAKAGFSAEDFQHREYRHLFQLLIGGNWDLQGEATAAKLYNLTQPLGHWEEYLRRFRTTKWSRQVMKIEEKLTVMENQESNMINAVYRLLFDYFRVRKQVYTMVHNQGPLGRGGSG